MNLETLTSEERRKLMVKLLSFKTSQEVNDFLRDMPSFISYSDIFLEREKELRDIECYKENKREIKSLSAFVKKVKSTKFLKLSSVAECYNRVLRSLLKNMLSIDIIKKAMNDLSSYHIHLPAFNDKINQLELGMFTEFRQTIQTFEDCMTERAKLRKKIDNPDILAFLDERCSELEVIMIQNRVQMNLNIQSLEQLLDKTTFDEGKNLIKDLIRKEKFQLQKENALKDPRTFEEIQKEMKKYKAFSEHRIALSSIASVKCKIEFETALKKATTLQFIKEIEEKYGTSPISENKDLRKSYQTKVKDLFFNDLSL